jgi:hypothetical protein
VKGVVITKPNKPDYVVAKAHQVIMLMWSAKVVKQMAVNIFTANCGSSRLVHDGQFIFRQGRSAVD